MEIEEWWIRVEIIISLIRVEIERVVLIVDGIVNRTIKSTIGVITRHRERIYEDGGWMEVDGIGKEKDGIGE